LRTIRVILLEFRVITVGIGHCLIHIYVGIASRMRENVVWIKHTLWLDYMRSLAKVLVGRNGWR